MRILRINPGDPDTTRSKLRTMLAAGQPPDVFYLPPDMLAQMAGLKLIRPLDEFVAKENKKWVDDFVPVVLNTFRYDTSTGASGRGPLYALPKDFTTTGFYININLFEAAGIDWRDIQKNGWTWDRFAVEMKKINALRNQPAYQGRTIYGTYLWIWSDTLRDILWTFGGEFFHYDANGNPLFRQLALDTPEAQAGMKFIRRLRLEDRVCYNPTGMAKDGSQEFINGNIGCAGPVGTWLAPTYKTITAFKWDVVPVPYAKAPASVIFLTGWTMSSACREPDAAYQLIHFLCGEEGQILAAKSGLAMPSRNSAMATFLNPPPPQIREIADPAARSASIYRCDRALASPAIARRAGVGSGAHQRRQSLDTARLGKHRNFRRTNSKGMDCRTRFADVQQQMGIDAVETNRTHHNCRAQRGRHRIVAQSAVRKTGTARCIATMRRHLFHSAVAARIFSFDTRTDGSLILARVQQLDRFDNASRCDICRQREFSRAVWL